MPDDINNDFLENPSDAIESYEDNYNENVDSSASFESDSASDFLDSEIEVVTPSESIGELVDPDDSFDTVDFDFNPYAIYGSDIPVESIETSLALNQLNSGGDPLPEGNVYVVNFRGSEYRVFFPSSVLSDLAVSNGILLNMGSETLYGSVLTDRSDSVSDTLLFVLAGCSSPSGHTSKLRYGDYSALRTYTYSGGSYGYTSSDTYGSLSVVSEPPLFSQVSYAPYVAFALCVVVGVCILRKLFRGRDAI